MILSNKQKMLLHTAAAQAGYGGAEHEDERRMVQRNIGGFFSAADKTATREGFIAVMAFYEKHCGGQIGDFTRGYWAAEDAKANPLDSLRFRVNKLAAEMGWTPADVDAFLHSKHMSSGIYGSVEEASAYWLTRLLEGLKAIRQRKAGTA
jgi:hypothetical protein